MYNREDVIEKFYLKEKALELHKRGKLLTINYLKARDFLKELLENPLFKNDYFVYRRLTMLYNDNGYFEEEYQIIKSFFKSEIYCHSYQVLWFKNKFKALIRKNYATEEELNELESYYNQNCLKNKSKVNDPTFIAERIYKIKGSITAISETEYNIKQFGFELVEKAMEFNRVGEYDKAIEIYKDLIFKRNKRQYKYYEQLAILYRKTGQIEEEFNIIDEYINENPYKREEIIEKFGKRLDNLGDYSFSSVKKVNTNKNSTNDGFIDFLLKNGPSADISEFNKNTSNEIEADFEEEIFLDEEMDFEENHESGNNEILEKIHDFENSSESKNINRTYEYEEPEGPIIKSSVKRNYLSSSYQYEGDSVNDKKESSKKFSDNEKTPSKNKNREFIETIAPYFGIENVFSHIVPVDEKYVVEDDKTPKFFEYDSSLTFEENLNRKCYLKQYGRSFKRKYEDAIEFYKSLLNNSYFENDWYPYRQLCINYRFNESYEDSLENVKNVFCSDIYLNEYQITWFTNKIRLLEDHIDIDMDQIRSCLDYYQDHGAKNQDNFSINVPHADGWLLENGEILVYSKESFDLVQDIYSFIETGRILEDKEKYGMAINFYLDKIENGYPLYEFYKRICMCLEKLDDFKEELEYIKFYYQNPPIDVTSSSDTWFKNRLLKVNNELGTDYSVVDFQSKN